MNYGIWGWLGIEPTDDIDAIKAAYAEQAKKYHPAEHPEEFKKLRECYKEAIARAGRNATAKARDDFFQNVSDEKDLSEQNIISLRPEMIHVIEPEDEYESEDEEEEYEDEYESEDDEEEYEDEYESKDDEEYEEEYEDEYVFSHQSFDFSKITTKEKFSDRQKNMLVLAESFFYYLNTQPHTFGNPRIIATVLWNWNQSPYSECITPDFIDSLLCRLETVYGINKAGYDIIEKALFSGKNATEYDLLHNRFKSIVSLNLNKTKIKKYKDKWQVNALAVLSKCSGCNVLNLSVGYFFDQGIFFKKNMSLIANLLIFKGKKLKYYFISDLTCIVDDKTDNITIKNAADEIILKVDSTNPQYQFLLRHLINEKVKLICNREINPVSMMTDLKDIRKLFLYEISALKSLLINFVIADIFIVQFAYSSALYADEVFLGELIYCISIVLMFFSVIPIVKMMGAGLRVISGAFGVIRILPKLKEFRNDIKQGKAVYALGSDAYIMGRFLVWNQSLVDTVCTYRILPFRKIEHMTAFQQTQNQIKADLAIKLTSGDMAHCRNVQFLSTSDYIQLISERRDEFIKSSRECELKEISGKNHKLFIGKYLNRNLRYTYQMAVCMVLLMPLVPFYTWYDKRLTEIYGSSYSDISAYVEACAIPITLVVTVALFIWGVISLWSYYRIPLQTVVSAGIELKCCCRYYSKPYDIYVLDSYLVQSKWGILKVIPYSDILSVTREEKNGISAIILEVANGKKVTLCGDRSAAKAINQREVTNIMNVIGEIYR
jgi:curved DNA-binding protein CbpA